MIGVDGHGPLQGQADGGVGQAGEEGQDDEGEDDQAAEQAYRRSIRILKGLPGEQGVVVCDTLAALADLLQNRGEYDEAVSLLRESVRIRRTVAPHQRLQIATTLSALTRTLLIEGKGDAASGIALEAMSAWRRALPAGSLVIAGVAVQFAEFHLEQGDLEAAKPLWEEALEIYATAPNPPTRYRDMAVRGLYLIVDRQEASSPEFVSTRLELIEFLRRVVGEDNPTVGRVLAETAEHLEDRGQAAEAVPVYIEALEICLKTGNELDPIEDGLEALRRTAWQIARDSARPAAEYETALRGAEMFLAVRSGTFDVVNIAGALQYRLGRYEEALKTFARAEEFRLPEHEGDSLVEVAFGAMAHYQLGHRDDARTALARLRHAIQAREGMDNEDNQTLLAETEALIGESDAGALEPDN